MSYRHFWCTQYGNPLSIMGQPYLYPPPAINGMHFFVSHLSNAVRQAENQIQHGSVFLMVSSRVAMIAALT
ncbi:hypothetical protein BH18THE2_BH18THE2_36110 [soil metagenome]